MFSCEFLKFSGKAIFSFYTTESIIQKWIKSLQGLKIIFGQIMLSPNMLGINCKKTKTVLHGFIEIVTESKRKPNKLCVDREI